MHTSKSCTLISLEKLPIGTGEELEQRRMQGGNKTRKESERTSDNCVASNEECG